MSEAPPSTGQKGPQKLAMSDVRSEGKPQGSQTRTWLIILFLGLFLGALFLPRTPYPGHPSPQSEQSIRLRMMEIETALVQFLEEYESFPIMTQSAGQDEALRSHGVFIAALTGRFDRLNPRKIICYQPAFARSGINGLIDASGGAFNDPADLTVVDAFGEMYYILLDTNKDGKIANPWSDVKTVISPDLETSILIYYSGPDRDPKTWEDNITSWR